MSYVEMFVFAVGRDRCRRLVVFLVMIQSVENVTVIGGTQSCLSSFWIPIFDSMFLLDAHLPDKNIFLGRRTDATFHCFNFNMLLYFCYSFPTSSAWAKLKQPASCCLSSPGVTAPHCTAGTCCCCCFTQALKHNSDALTVTYCYM